jgi:hypothetical protein
VELKTTRERERESERKLQATRLEYVKLKEQQETAHRRQQATAHLRKQPPPHQAQGADIKCAPAAARPTQPTDDAAAVQQSPPQQGPRAAPQPPRRQQPRMGGGTGVRTGSSTTSSPGLLTPSSFISPMNPVPPPRTSFLGSPPAAQVSNGGVTSGRRAVLVTET